MNPNGWVDVRGVWPVYVFPGGIKAVVLRDVHRGITAEEAQKLVGQL